MIAADPSNPQWVGLALRRRLDLPLPSGVVMVLRIAGYLFVAAGPSGRARTVSMPRRASALYMLASPCLEGG
jgi:hypothetical protein